MQRCKKCNLKALYVDNARARFIVPLPVDPYQLEYRTPWSCNQEAKLLITNTHIYITQYRRGGVAFCIEAERTVGGEGAWPLSCKGTLRERHHHHSLGPKPDAQRGSTGCIATYMEGMLQVSNMIWVICSLWTLFFQFITTEGKSGGHIISTLSLLV